MIIEKRRRGMMSKEHSDRSYRSLSFSGCGFLCVYHAGVSAAIKEYAPQLLSGAVSGASAGSIIAACLVCNICISRTTSLILNVVNQARSYTFGALNRDFDLMGIVRADLEMELPENAHILCSGRLRISLTRLSDMENVIVSHFNSKAELIQAIICSCFIPVYGGLRYPEFRGEIYIDGGATDNQPVTDEYTITVSPFSGANDICPSDADSASMLDLMFSGTSIRFTANNLYRLMVSLFPPSTEVCSRMCKQGFVDALKFLINNGLTPCAHCLTVQTNLLSTSSMQPTAHARTTRWKKSDSINSTDNKTRNTSGCETCSGMRKPLLDSRTSLLFPTIMQKLFEEFVEVDDTILAYLQCYGFRYLTKFFAYPIRIYIQLLKFCASLLSYITSHASNWFTRRLQKVVSFVLYEIDSRQKFLPFVLAELLESSQFEYSTKNQLMDYYKKAVNRSQSSDASSCLHEREPVIAENRKEDRLETFIEETDETSSMEGIGEDHDSISRVVDYMKHHDAVLAYYYTDDKKQMCMCEIFDMDHEDKRHECHSLLDLPN